MYRRPVFNGIVVGLALLATVLAGSAQGREWSAKWISQDKASDMNTWTCFRQSFELNEVPDQATAHIAVDSKYWLWVNGDLAVFEGQLRRGPTPHDTYYDTVNLAKHLRNGNNTIAVLVQHYGRQSFSHHDSGKAGLLFEAQFGKKQVVSDGTWKAKVHPAYGTTGEPQANYRLPERNVRFDARKALGQWHGRDYDVSAWEQANVVGTPPTKPWNKLYPRPIPQWKVSELRAYESIKRKPGEDGGTIFIGTLPYNAQVTPYFEVKGEAGKTIDIRTDSWFMFQETKWPFRAEYITKSGAQSHESLVWQSGHEVRYTVPEGVEVIELKYRESGYNAEFVGSFKSSDQALNDLWAEAKRTLYVTMRDTYMDCPDRERAQWWGDAVNELGEAFYVFDYERGPLLAKKGIYELARWQRQDKTLYSPVPSGWRGENRLGPSKSKDGVWHRELPRQMLASVGWYGFWTYYWYTGDKQTIEDVYPAVRRYMSLWKLKPNGLIKHRSGEWDWVDWGKHKDVPVIENAWVYLALKGAMRMAKLTGHEEDIADYRRKMESIKANFNKTFWRGNEYRSSGHDGPTDDRANSMAVIAGLAKADYYPSIREVLANEYHASPYMEKYVLESLYKMRAPEQAIARMKKRFGGMLDDEFSTLWENFTDDERPGGGSYNHAWSGGALTVLSQYAAGVAPTAPAYQEYQVLPQLGPLTELDTVVPTPHGTIDLEMRKSSDRFEISIASPGGQATVGIPQESDSTIETVFVNGDRVWAKEGQGESPDGIHVKGPINGYVQIIISDPGHYQILGR
jgi:hypothetical protein